MREFLQESQWSPRLGSVVEDTFVFLFCCGIWGLGNYVGKRQWNLIRHFPELSTCPFLECSLFGPGKAPCSKEHRCSGRLFGWSVGIMKGDVVCQGRYSQERVLEDHVTVGVGHDNGVCLCSCAFKNLFVIINDSIELCNLRLCFGLVGMREIALSRRKLSFNLVLLNDWGSFPLWSKNWFLRDFSHY